jgi:hypothetical protein
MLGFFDKELYQEFYQKLLQLARSMQWAQFPMSISAENVTRLNGDGNLANENTKYQCVSGYVIDTFLQNAFGLVLVEKKGRGSASAFLNNEVVIVLLFVVWMQYVWHNCNI